MASGAEPEVKDIPEAQNRYAIQIHPEGGCKDPVMGETDGVVGFRPIQDVKMSLIF